MAGVFSGYTGALQVYGLRSSLIHNVQHTRAYCCNVRLISLCDETVANAQSTSPVLHSRTHVRRLKDVPFLSLITAPT